MTDTPAAYTIPRLLTLTEAAGVLGWHPRTVRRRIDDGSLPAVVEHGRTLIRGDELRSYIDTLARVGRSSGAARRRERPRPYVSLVD